MRWLTLAALTFLLGLFGCSGQTQQVSLEQPDDLSFSVEWHERFPTLASVHFINEKSGWAVGSSGAILATIDGGQSWKRQESGVAVSLSSVHFINEKSGWAVGNKGTILATTDGGQSWKRQESGTGIDLNLVYFINEKSGWVVGGGEILVTTDGGQSWKRQESGIAQLRSVQFINDRIGWVLGYGSTVLTTTDGGQNWKRQEGAVSAALNSIYFVNEKSGWAVGSEGTILATTDGGQSWTRQKSGVHLILFSVHFVNERSGWIVGMGGTILVTTDGGQSWRSQVSGVKADLWSAHFVNEKSGWAVGDGRTILATTDGGQSWKRQEDGIDTNLNSVRFVNEKSGWAVGDSGTILATTDGGQNWKRQERGPAEKLNSVHFINEKSGWAVGNEGTILATTDGGQSWMRQESGTDAHLSSIHFVDEKSGWVVGERGTILATIDGGQSWKPQLGGVIANLKSVYFINEKSGWAVGDGNTILATIDRGQNWKQQESGVSQDLRSIHFVSEKRGWIVGGSTILTTSDGGQNWKRQESGVGAYLNSVYFINEKNGWAVGVGPILATTDGGQSWKRQNHGVSAPLFSVHLVNEKSGCAVGMKGTIQMSEFKEYAPYPSSLSVTDDALSTVIKYRVQHSHPERTKFIKLEYRTSEIGKWREIENLQASSIGPGEFETRWNPSSTEYSISEGSKLYYQMTLSSHEGTAYTSKIPAGFVYHSWWERQSGWINLLVGLVGMVATWVIFCLLLLWLHPISLLRLFSFLQNYSGALPDPVGKALLIPITLSFLPYFARHPRTRQAWLERYRKGQVDFSKLPQLTRSDFVKQQDCLDAWVERRAARAVDSFNQIPSVRQRKIYIPMPLREGDLATGELISTPQPSDFRHYLQTERSVLAVIGMGGSGKSALACQLARWGLAENQQDRLADHRIIPVLLEEETTNLLESVTRRLTQMVGHDEVDTDLIRSLLQHKRLMVIVDALSERGHPTQLHVQSIHGAVPVNALIVTTRREPNFGPVTLTRLWPEKVNVNNLGYFLNEYLRRTNAEQYFTGRQQWSLGGRLLDIVERGSERLVVTPLLIQLFVENAITEFKREGKLEQISNSVPEIMLDYLRHVNPADPITPNFIPNDRMIRATRVLGWCSLRGFFIPRDFSRDEAESELKAAGLWDDKSDVIARLISNGVIENRDVGGDQILRFGLDPLAEYLAALHLLRQCGNNLGKWEEQLSLLTFPPERYEEIQGFIVALEDCITTYKQQSNIPDLVFPWKGLLSPEGRIRVVAELTG